MSKKLFNSRFESVCHEGKVWCIFPFIFLFHSRRKCLIFSFIRFFNFSLQRTEKMNTCFHLTSLLLFVAAFLSGKNTPEFNTIWWSFLANSTKEIDCIFSLKMFWLGFWINSTKHRAGESRWWKLIRCLQLKKKKEKKNQRIDLIKWMSFHCKLWVLLTLFAKADVQIKKIQLHWGLLRTRFC